MLSPMLSPIDIILNETPVPIRISIAAALPEGELHQLSPDTIHQLVVAVSCYKSSNVMLTPQ